MIGKISIDRVIKVTTELLAGLEQQSFISEQEIMNVYFLQDKLIKERPMFTFSKINLSKKGPNI